MCCCGKPVMNGTLGFKWQPSDAVSIYPLNPPELLNNDQLLFDEPGRCFNGLDSHSHHYRLVKNNGIFYILVRNGLGDYRVDLDSSSRTVWIETFEKNDSDNRYLIMQSIYNLYYRSVSLTEMKCNQKWAKAYTEKRIKIRRKKGLRTVYIIDPVLANLE